MTAIGRSGDWSPGSEPRSSWFDKPLFLALFLLGAAVIVVGKAFNVSQWVVTFIPVGFVVLYAVATWFSDRLHIEEAAGDSVYYLGFLFTLVSVGVALYHFSVDPAQTADFVANFGIALLTTIAGLALRVLLTQEQRHPSDVEASARLDLARAAHELRTEIDGAVEQVKGFSDQVLRTSDQAARETAKLTSVTLTGAVEDFRRAIGETLEAVTQPAAEFNESAKRVKTAVTRVGTATEQLAARLDAIEVPPDLLEKKLAGVLSSLDEAVDKQHAATNSVVQATDQLASRLGAIEVPPDLLVRKVDSALAGLTAVVSEHTGALRDSLGTYGEFLDAMRTSIASFDTLEGTAAGFRDSVTKAVAALAAIESNSAALERLVATLAALQEPMAQLGDQARAFGGSVGAAAADVVAHIGAMKAHRMMLADELEVVREQTAALRHGAVDFAAAVAEHGHELKKAAEAQAGAARELTRLSGVLSDIDPALRKVITTATAMGDAVAPADAAARHLRELATTLTTTDERLMSLATALSRHQLAFTEFAKVAEDDTIRVKQHREALDTEVEQARAQLQRFHGSLLGLAQTILKELNAPPAS